MQEMMHSWEILSGNADFLSQAYNAQMLLWFIPFMLLDVVLKGWALWRAARMGKMAWFIALLIVNSVGILPALFLLMTNDEYAKWVSSKSRN